jgi:hypothetical protein
MDVEEQRARSIGDVGRMDPGPGELPQEPRIDRAEDEPALPRGLARAVDVLEDPVHLRAAEIGVEHEPRLRRDRGFEPLRSQCIARGSGAPVLPHDRVADRLAGDAVPDERRFALVRNADRRDVRRPQARARHRFGRDCELRGPDLVRVVLDPSGLREDLLELLLGNRDDAAAAIEDDRARARRSLVEREDAGQANPPDDALRSKAWRGPRHAFRIRLMPLAASSTASMRWKVSGLTLLPRRSPTRVPTAMKGSSATTRMSTSFV